MSRAARLALGVLVLGLVVGPARGAPADQETLQLARAVAEHPDDPDLLFAEARWLAEVGRGTEAAERLTRLLGRWPAYRPEASALLGRLWLDQGRPAEALVQLERAARLDPASGSTQFFLGLALKALGRTRDAGERFERAAELTPELRSEAWLLAGLARLEGADVRGGDELLARVIAVDPEGEAARSARLVLEGLPPDPRRLRLQARGGFEYDSNVTLDSGAPGAGLPADSGDFAFSWGSGIAYDLLRRERSAVSLGAVYQQTAHLELDDWDSQQVGGIVSAAWQADQRVALQLDARILHVRLDDDPYVLVGGVYPSSRLLLGPRAGWLRVFASGDRSEYDEEPFTSALERDGWTAGAGLEHELPLPRLEGAWFSWYGSWERYLPDSGADDSLGFANAFAHDGFGGGGRLRVVLPWRVGADLGLSYFRERYAHENLVDALTDEGVGTANPARRRDGIVETRLRLTRPITRLVAIEVFARYADRASNVDVYSYERWVSGLAVNLSTP